MALARDTGSPGSVTNQRQHLYIVVIDVSAYPHDWAGPTTRT